MSIRVRIVLLLLLVVVPFSALLIHNAAERYDLLARSIKDQTLRHAQLAAANQGEAIELTRQLLETLADDPIIRGTDRARCNDRLREVQEQFSTSYQNFTVANLNGDVVCSGFPITAKINLRDRKNFQEVLATRQFVVGDLVVSRVTGKLTVPYSYPVLNARGNLVSVVSAAVSTESFAAPEARIALPEGGELLIVDRTGTVILHQPGREELIGQRLSGSTVVRAMLARSEGLVEASGMDGVARVYGFARAGKSVTQAIHVAIGIPLETILAEANRQLRFNIAVVLGVTALVLALGWFEAEALLLRKIRVLVNTLTKLRGGETSARTGLAYGADELSHIARAIDETADDLQRTVDSLRQLSLHDPLTGLYNRRYLEESLDQVLKRARRDNQPVAAIMADADHFKHINDTHGHECGDKVLLGLAGLLTERVRSGDIACRFGGEEFMFIMPEAPLEVARARAEEIRKAAQGLVIDCEGKRIGPVTLSLGVAIFPAHGNDVQALLRSADAALYEAKKRGRNCVVIAGVPGAG